MGLSWPWKVLLPSAHSFADLQRVIMYCLLIVSSHEREREIVCVSVIIIIIITIDVYMKLQRLAENIHFEIT